MFRGGFFFFPVGAPGALDCGMSLQSFVLVPAGVSERITTLDKFLYKFLAGDSCHILRV